MDRALNTIKWILLVSLLANAAFAGFVVSQVMGGRRAFGPGPQMREMARPNQPQLSEKERTILNQALAAERSNMDTALRNLQDARRITIALLRASTIDGPALDAAMADMRAKTIAAQEIYHRVIAVAAPQLTPQERANLTRIFNAAPAKFGIEAMTPPQPPGTGPNGGPRRENGFKEGGPKRPQGSFGPPGGDAPSSGPPP